MVKWSYATVSKIATKQPFFLVISVKKSANFNEVFDAFEIERTARRMAFEVKKEAEKLAAVAGIAITEAETTHVKVAESVVEEAQ